MNLLAELLDFDHKPEHTRRRHAEHSRPQQHATHARPVIEHVKGEDPAAQRQASWSAPSPMRALVGSNGSLQMQGLLTLESTIVNQTVTLPMLLQQTSCAILELHLGALNLSCWASTST